MEQEGWVTYVIEQEGNRPERRVYSVTEDGEKAFYRLLRKNLSAYASPEFPSCVGLDFIHKLSLEEAVSLLENRLKLVKEKFQQIDDISEEIRQTHLAIHYLHQFYAKEIEWIGDVLYRLQSN